MHKVRARALARPEERPKIGRMDLASPALQNCLLTELFMSSTVMPSRRESAGRLSVTSFLSRREQNPSYLMNTTSNTSGVSAPTTSGHNSGNIRAAFRGDTLEIPAVTGNLPTGTRNIQAKPKSKPTKQRPPFSGKKIVIAFEIPVEIAPAFRSAVDEISNELGERLEGPHSFDREEAITDAVMALGALRAAFFSRVPAGHPRWDR